MGILDNLQPPAKKVWSCLVRTTAEKLEPEDAKALLEAAMNPAWKYTTLQDALAERGIEISYQSIRTHRIGRCSCSKI